MALQSVLPAPGCCESVHWHCSWHSLFVEHEYVRWHFDGSEGLGLSRLMLVKDGFCRFIRWLALSVNGGLSRNSIGWEETVVWHVNWYLNIVCTAPRLFSWMLALVCSTIILIWMFSLNQCGSVLTWFLKVSALGWETVAGSGWCRNNIRLEGVLFVDLCTCLLYAYDKGCTCMSQPFWF